MKKLIIGAAAVLISFSAAITAQAGDRTMNGMIIGAGSGAIAGQAIGRNTEATLIGTAIGGLLGAVIGSEIDRGYHQHVQYGPPQTVVYQQPVVMYPPPPPPPPVHRPVVIEHHREYRHAPPCREAEILGSVNGRPRRINGTVCMTDHGWELVSDPGRSPEVRWDNRGPHHPHRFDRRF